MFRTLVFIALSAGTLYAASEDNTAIHGRVVDGGPDPLKRVSSDLLPGTPLPGATVRMSGPGNSARGTVTDTDGRYEIDRLPPGEYHVSVSYIGYGTVASRTISVSSGASVSLNFALPTEILLGEQVVVSASRRREKVLDAPASVVVIDAAEIRNLPALNIAEHISSAPSVDYVKTGLVQSSTVVRGFNNVFSGALLTLVDNRITRVPSLRINSHYFIPQVNEDIERIEIVLGPGSALYGPNSADGVLHIITSSPLDHQGTAVRIGGGERSLRNVSFRHAGKVNDKVGFKLSTRYYKGNDWYSEDPEEVRLRGSNPRDFDLDNRAGELRFDFRPSDDASAIIAGGFTQATNLEMTSLGTAQAKDWKYSFLQGRFRYKELFAQVFYNKSDAGDTELIRTQDPIVDKSQVTVLQLQHRSALAGGRQQFTYGMDALWTRPDTEGTINGVNETKDDVNEYGIYLQSETELMPQVDLVLAARYDEHNFIEDPVFSPRAALVLKPAPQQTLRFTYNRAFGTPTSTNLFLDLLSTPDPFGLGNGFEPALGYRPGIDIRAQGSRDGFTFNRDTGGRPTFRSPFAPVAGLTTDQHISLDDPQFTNVMWGLGRAGVMAVLIPQFGQLATQALRQQYIDAGLPVDNAVVDAQVQALLGGFQTLIPQTLPGLTNVLRSLDPQTATFLPVTDVEDLPVLRPTELQTFEVGYKGVLGSKLLFTADVYRTKRTDFVSPLRVETPNVFLDPAALAGALGANLGQALAAPENALLAGALLTLDAPAAGGNGNGSAVDELTTFFVAGTASNGAAFIPFGTVTPEQATDPTAVTLAYRNFGNLTLYGIDASMVWYATPEVSVMGNYSYVGENVLKDPAGVQDLALNVPTHKFNFGITRSFPQFGLEVGGKVRYRGSFPMASGVFVGDIEAYTLIDAHMAYEIPLNMGGATVTLDANASNLLNNEHLEFAGAPEIGRLVSAGFTVRF